jgi:hypothetical protein
MQQYLIMCRSLTYAQRAVFALERAGITVATARAPQELTDGGCGYCVKVSERRFRDALKVLDKAGLPYGRIYVKGPEAGYREVAG